MNPAIIKLIEIALGALVALVGLLIAYIFLRDSSGKAERASADIQQDIEAQTEELSAINDGIRAYASAGNPDCPTALRMVDRIEHLFSQLSSRTDVDAQAVADLRDRFDAIKKTIEFWC